MQQRSGRYRSVRYGTMRREVVRDEDRNSHQWRGLPRAQRGHPRCGAQGTEVHGQEFVGFLDGWRGLVEGDVIPLDRSRVRGLAQQGGTILGTSRFGPYQGPTVGHRTSRRPSAASGSTR